MFPFPLRQMDAETSAVATADGDALSSVLSDRDLRVSIQVCNVFESVR